MVFNFIIVRSNEQEDHYQKLWALGSCLRIFHVVFIHNGIHPVTIKCSDTCGILFCPIVFHGENRPTVKCQNDIHLIHVDVTILVWSSVVVIHFVSFDWSRLWSVLYWITSGPYQLSTCQWILSLQQSTIQSYWVWISKTRRRPWGQWFLLMMFPRWIFLWWKLVLQNIFFCLVDLISVIYSSLCIKIKAICNVVFVILSSGRII